MRFSSPVVLATTTLGLAGLVSAAPHAHPFNDGQQQQLTFASTLADKVYDLVEGIVHPHQADVQEEEDEPPEEDKKTLWHIINHNEHFTQLAHVLNYSSDSTKDLLKNGDGLTLFGA